jgi:hypothetical protein
MLELPAAFTFLYLNKTIKGCWYGSANVHEDVPKLLDLWKEGRLKLEELISKEIEVTDVNDAFAAMQNGEVARSVIRYDVTSYGTPGGGSGCGAGGPTADRWRCAWSGPDGTAPAVGGSTVPGLRREQVERAS